MSIGSKNHLLAIVFIAARIRRSAVRFRSARYGSRKSFMERAANRGQYYPTNVRKAMVGRAFLLLLAQAIVLLSRPDLAETQLQVAELQPFKVRRQTRPLKDNCRSCSYFYSPSNSLADGGPRVGSREAAF